jgi:hypothetical protein
MCVSRSLLLIAHSTRPTQEEGAMCQQSHLTAPSILAPSTPPQASGGIVQQTRTTIGYSSPARQYPRLTSSVKKSHLTDQSFLYGTLEQVNRVSLSGRDKSTHILNNGSQTVTARLDTCPFARLGGSRRKCLSAEHSKTRPYNESSSRKRS